MKKILFPSIIIILVLILTSFSFAAYEFYLKGVVIKISGNNITIKNNEGKITIVKGHVKDLKVGDTVEINNGKITKSGNNSSIQPLYKDGEDGVNRTSTGKNKPGMNPSVKPLYKDGEDGVNRTSPGE